MLTTNYEIDLKLKLFFLPNNIGDKKDIIMLLPPTLAIKLVTKRHCRQLETVSFIVATRQFYPELDDISILFVMRINHKRTFRLLKPKLTFYFLKHNAKMQ